MCSTLTRADSEERDAEAGVSTKKTRLRCNTPTGLLPWTIIHRGLCIFVFDCEEIQGRSWKCCRAPSIRAMRAAEPQGCPSNRSPPGLVVCRTEPLAPSWPGAHRLSPGRPTWTQGAAVLRSGFLGALAPASDKWQVAQQDHPANRNFSLCSPD